MKQGTATATNGHSSQVVAIPLRQIILSTLAPQEQRRQHFSPDSLKELASSMAKQGQIQAIVVRPQTGKKGHTPSFELVAGRESKSRIWR